MKYKTKGLVFNVVIMYNELWNKMKFDNFYVQTTIVIKNKHFNTICLEVNLRHFILQMNDCLLNK